MKRFFIGLIERLFATESASVRQSTPSRYTAFTISSEYVGDRVFAPVVAVEKSTFDRAAHPNEAKA
jgi:hypothetical protein